MGDREELAELEELDRLEQKAKGPAPSTLDVAKSAVNRGAVNLINTPVALANVAIQGLAGPFLRDKVPTIPNYPMQVAEATGLVDPKKEPQTAVQRIVDSAIQAGTQAGLVTGPAGAAIGGVAGAAGQAVKELTGSNLLAIATGMAAPFAMRSTAASPLNNPTRNETLREAQEAGYVVQPSTVKPSFITNKLETVAGKAAVAQDASVRNQVVTDKLAAKSLGLPEDTPITMDVIQEVRKRAAKPYEEIAQLSPRASTALDKLKESRFEAKEQFTYAYKSGNPDALKAARAADAKAEQYERVIEREAKQAGRPELLEQLKAGRQMTARTYDVEKALTVGDGHVSAPAIGRMIDQGKPLTGELAVIGKFATAFPRVSREGAQIPPPTVSGTDAAAMALLGSVGYGAGGPVGAAVGALPLLRAPARNLVLNQRYQSSLLTPPTSMAKTAVRSGLVGSSLYDFHDKLD